MQYRICMSVGQMDEAFEKMRKELEKIAAVDVADLSERDLAGYDIFIGKKLSPKMLATADKLKAIFAYKTGVDEFPLSELHARNICLMNSHADSEYIAEYAFGLSVSLTNRIAEFDKKMRRGVWHDTENPYWKSFFAMKVGLMGYGHIGRAVHRILERNNMDVYTIDRGHSYENITPLPSFAALCQTCDLLIFSLPKTPETDAVINRESLALLRGKYIVNVGRSNCIDEEALYNALKNGELAGAANDTWRQKPKNPFEKGIPSEYDFGALDNMILSPHQAMRVRDGHSRYVEDTTDKVIRYIQNGEKRDVVDLAKGY